MSKDIEAQALRFAEIYRLQITNELTELDQYDDLEEYLRFKQNCIISDMEIETNSNDFDAFSEYIDLLKYMPNKKAS